MKKVVVIMVFLGFFLVDISATAFSFGGEYRSRYIWRGLDFYRGNRGALQGYLKYKPFDGVSIKVFVSFALKDRDKLKDLEEIDLILNYSKDLGGVVLSCGFSNYGFYFREKFDFERDNSQEMNLGFKFRSLPLKPSVTIYWDAGFKRWFYIDFAIFFDLIDSNKLTFGFKGDLGFDGKQNVEKAGFSNGGLELRLMVKAGKKLKITPYMKYVRVFKNEINPSDNEFVMGFRFDI